MPYSRSVHGPPTNRPCFNSPSTGCNSTPVLVMGHSFVRRADQYLRNKRIRNLHLPLSEFSVTLQGRGGAYARHLPELYDKCNVTPDMVVIDIGTNDLSMVKTDQEATDVAKRVFAFANTLVARGVKRVVILEVLPRTRHGRHGAPRSFDSLVASYNWQMVRLITQSPESTPINWWFHEDLSWQRESFIMDGVHLNDDGLALYLESLNKAIRRFSQNLNCSRM